MSTKKLAFALRTSNPGAGEGAPVQLLVDAATGNPVPGVAELIVTRLSDTESVVAARLSLAGVRDYDAGTPEPAPETAPEALLTPLAGEAMPSPRAAGVAVRSAADSADAKEPRPTSKTLDK